MKTQLINFTIPKSLLRQVDLVAKKTARSRSSVLREGARLIANRVKEKDRNFRIITASAKRIDMAEEEAIGLIDKTRKGLQINK